MFTKKRSDGSYIRDLPYFTRLMPYLMPTRSEACIYFEQDFDVTKALAYVRAANADRAPGQKKLTLFLVVLCATVRTIGLRPKLNRFVAGFRYYQRNRIIFNFVAKRELTDGGSEINVTLPFSPFETLSTLQPKVSAYVSRIKSGETTDADDLNEFLARLPRFVNRIVFGTLSFLDYHNALPPSFTKGLPFYSTVFFTNVGSVGIDAPFHHNFEFGTCGLFVAIGKIRRERVPGADGSLEERDRVKVTFTYDDRITDGIYCGKAIDLLRSFVEDPSTLETPPELSPDQLAELALAE
ncbi:MAG: 2-oxo acid dehydrogenase subunit E2 [Rectinemataceae bacterium]|jgi:hypothetical protein